MIFAVWVAIAFITLVVISLGIYAFFERRDYLQLISTEHPECIKPRCGSTPDTTSSTCSSGKTLGQYPAYRLEGAFCAPIEDNVAVGVSPSFT